jgi:hypothetical protein
MIHLLLATSSSPSGIDQADTVFAILASAIIAFGGIAAFVRMIWKTANMLRDNTNAAKILNVKVDELDSRLEHLAERIATLESQERHHG